MGAQPAQSPFTPWLLTTLISSDTKPLGACPVSAIALAWQKPCAKSILNIPCISMLSICWARLPFLKLMSHYHSQKPRNSLKWFVCEPFQSAIPQNPKCPPSGPSPTKKTTCTRVRSTSNGKTTAQVNNAADAPAVAVWMGDRLSGIISRKVPWFIRKNDFREVKIR